MSAQRCVFCDEPAEGDSSFCDSCALALSLELSEEKVMALDERYKAKNEARRIVEGFKIAKGED